jgi:hypothetical protein
MGITGCDSNCQCLDGTWQAPCPADLPQTGSACTTEGAECGYTTSTNACEADNCYCKSGVWNCEPSCAIGPAIEDAAADAFVAQCTNAAACKVGEVCCVITPGTTNCQAGPCPSVPANSSWGGGPFQLCATAAECFAAGDTCGVFSEGPGNLPGIFACNAPADGGTTEAATDSGPLDADACAPSGCTGSCLSGRHNVSTVVNGCTVWQCCMPDDAGADANGE